MVSRRAERRRRSARLISPMLAAVNIMLWSSDAPDGSPGVAAWDLFRAEDAELVSSTIHHVARPLEQRAQSCLFL